MMTSLNELSKKLGISKPGLELRMKRHLNFRTKYCSRTKKGELLINEDGCKLLSYAKSNSTSKNFHTRRGTGKRQLTSADKSETIKQLLHYNKHLISENKSLKSDKVALEQGYFHKMDLPSPLDWRNYQKNLKEQKKTDRLQQAKINQLTYTVNHPSLKTWWKSLWHRE